MITGVSDTTLLGFLRAHSFFLSGLPNFLLFSFLASILLLENTHIPISVLLQIDKIGASRSLYFIYQSNSVLPKVFGKHILEEVEHVCYVAFIA